MSNPVAKLRATGRLCLLAALSLALLAGAAQAAERPHILYIMADDLGWQDLGYLG